MSIANLLFKKNAGKIENIQLDVTISENHLYTSTVTKYPVEDGSQKSDHIINEPVSLTIEGFVTNTPVDFVSGKVGAMIRKEKYDKVKSNFEALLKIRNQKKVFSIVTGLKTYKDHFFQTLTIPRNNQTGETLRFTATTVPIVTVSAKTVRLKDISAKYSDIGQSTINKGSQNTKPVVKNTKLESAAFKLGKYFKGLF